MIEILLVISLGLAFGSFITCVSYRLPLAIDVVRKPSFCPNCLAQLTAKDLFPVFSWVFFGGKCRHCAVKISARYPLIEIVTVTIFMFIYLHFGGINLQFFLLAGMAVALMIMIVADLEHYIIPDTVHLLLFPLAIAYRFATATLSLDIFLGWGLMVGLALMLHYVYSWLRGRTMLGFGDVKFFAVAGLWLNLTDIPMFLLLAGGIGVVFGMVWRMLGKGQLFPFGPALAVALFVTVLFPELNILHK
jgi:prepilin signal peptidase PulO-like enzyme (type II secretory pathway)